MELTVFNIVEYIVVYYSDLLYTIYFSKLVKFNGKTYQYYPLARVQLTLGAVIFAS